MRTSIGQWAVLVDRNGNVFLADKPNLLLAVLLAPLIAVCMWLAFAHLDRDSHAADELARSVYHLHIVTQPLMDAGDPIGSEVIPPVRRAVEQETFLISDATAQRRAIVYFILVSAAVWFGVMGSCKEIVNEKHVLHRELHAGVHLLPWLLAKFTVQSVIVGVQTALLTAITLLVLPGGVAAGSGAQLWVLLWLTAVAAVALGLLISAVSPTFRVALTVVPLVMLMQLILGGLLRPPALARDGNQLRETLGCLTIQRWGFEASLATDRYATNGVLTVAVNSWDTLDERYGLLKVLSVSQSSLVACFFKERTAAVTWPVLERLYHGHKLMPAITLGLFTIGLLAVSYVILRCRFL